MKNEEKETIKNYFSKLGKISWKKQKKKKDSDYMRELQKKSVMARNNNKLPVDN